jgi:hypothetical protein
MLNMGKNAEPVRLSFPAYPVVQHMQAWRTSANESFAAQPDVVNANGVADIELPAQSIVTLYGAGTGDAPTKPTVPTNLLAQALNEAVNLTWTAGWHADTYTVQRATAPTGPFVSIAAGIRTTRYLDSKLTDGQQYFYQVAGQSAQGASPDSAVASATPMAVAVVYTATPPKLDDQVGPEWDAAKWYSLDHVVRGAAASPDTDASRFKAMWDADNLYTLMETTTPDVTVIPGKMYDTDGWEIYVDATGQRGPAYSKSDFHFVLPFGETEVQEVAHGQPLGGKCISFKTPTGYVIKAQIPLSVIGIAACNGDVFGIDFNVAAHRSALLKRAWWSAADFDWQNPSAFGAARLTGGTGQPPAQAPTIAATPGNSSVTLTWQPVPGAAGYRIERGIAGTPMAPIANISSSGDAPLKFVNLGVDEQNTWQYAVVPYSPAGPGTPSQPVSAKPLIESAPPASIMIHCGGPAIGRFDVDKDFTGGSVTANYLGPIVRDLVDPAPTEIYQTERNGKFSYSIPNLKPGQQYLLRLHFCENYWTAPGQRVFSVFANGKEIIHDLDIFKEAGGQHTALIHESTFTAPDDGKLNITFTIKTNGAIMQAIEVIPK